MFGIADLNLVSKAFWAQIVNLARFDPALSRQGVGAILGKTMKVLARHWTTGGEQ